MYLYLCICICVFVLVHYKIRAKKAVKVKEEEKQKYPIPGKKGEYYEWRMDMENVKKFKERDYMDALSHIGLLP